MACGVSPLFLFKHSADHPVLPSFPTRRSSDLRALPPAPPRRVRAPGVPPGRPVPLHPGGTPGARTRRGDRKSTRLNSSHVAISYAVFCLKKKKKKKKKNKKSIYKETPRLKPHA